MDRDADTLPEWIESLILATTADDEPSAELVRRGLGHGHERVRVIALRAAARRGLLEDADLDAARRDESPSVRREALTQIARGAGGRPDAVVSSLADPDALVAEAAAFALGERAVTSAVGELARAAGTHADARVREAAVAALGALGDPAGLPAIVAALDDRPPVRRRATVALAAFDDPRAASALERARADRDWQVRDVARRLSDEDGDEDGDDIPFGGH